MDMIIRCYDVVEPVPTLEAGMRGTAPPVVSLLCYCGCKSMIEDEVIKRHTAGERRLKKWIKKHWRKI